MLFKPTRQLWPALLDLPLLDRNPPEQIRRPEQKDTERDCVVGSQRRVSLNIDSRNADGFKGFGPSLIAKCARRPLQHLVFSRDLAEARTTIRQNIPVCPGVYGWLNPDDTLIYVGKSKSLRHRLVSYFATETTDPKMAKIRRHSRTLVWEPISQELLALIREQELITRLRPPYNVHGKPERRQPGFICVSRGMAPTLFFARQVPKRAAETFGPIAGRARLGEAIDCLNYVFQLRDCPDKIKMHFSNQLQLFGNDRTAQCLRYELDTCPGPCAGNCSHESYRHKVDKALKFLNGGDQGILKRLKTRMETAATNLSFERACVLRDQLDQMKWLNRRIKQLSAARRKLDGVWKMTGFDRQEHWMVLRAGQLLACTNGADDSASKVKVEEAKSSDSQIPQTHLEINLQLLLSSWIKKHPEQVTSLFNFNDLADSTDSTVSKRIA